MTTGRKIGIAAKAKAEEKKKKKKKKKRLVLQYKNVWGGATKNAKTFQLVLKFANCGDTSAPAVSKR